MGFKKLRGVKLPEEKQGFIRYTCLTLSEQPKWIQEKVKYTPATWSEVRTAMLFLS